MLGSGLCVMAVLRLEDRLTLARLLGVAAVLRVILLPLPPALSDDALRYVWDGRVVAAGDNPYLLAPEDPRLAPLRDDSWRVMPHKHVPTVYPPLALLLFTVVGFSPAPFLSLKIILAFADWLGCLLLARLAMRLGAPVGRAAWYAWNPLVTLEIAGQGHIDGLMLPLMILAVFWLTGPARPGWAGAAAASGILAKLVPLIALPVWARSLGAATPGDGFFARHRRSAIFLAVTAGLAGACLMPVLWSTGGVPPGLVTYGVSWEFNGPLYEPLWRLIDLADPVDEIKRGLDGAKDLTGMYEGGLWNALYHYVYPQMLAKLALAACFAAFLLRELVRGPRRHPVEASGRLFTAVLLAASTVYPWYVLWTLPWAALGRRSAGLALSFLVPLSYLPQHTDVPLFPWVWAVIWLPFFALLVRQPAAWDLNPDSSPDSARGSEPAFREPEKA